MALSGRHQIGAIVWAQWRTWLNRSPFAKSGFYLTAGLMVLWYGVWAAGAAAAAYICAAPDSLSLLQRAFGPALLVLTLYWQAIPVLMASSGLSLDLRRLRAYPVEHWHLFAIEAALRITTAIEVLLITFGAWAGIALNPALPSGSWTVFPLFIGFNLLLSSAIRDALTRVMARRRSREIFIVFIVLLSATPQILVAMNGVPQWVRTAAKYAQGAPWPWSLTASGALGENVLLALGGLLLWCLGAGAAARWQFERGLRENEGEARSRDAAGTRTAGWSERLFALPARLLPDPLGALVEKDLRSLARAPRFRLVFIMGFTFGLLIFFPMAFRGGGETNWMGRNFLTVASVYGVMMLAEVVIWNAFGFDRRAAQFYYTAPVKLTTVLVAKNITAGVCIVLNAVLITLVCLLVRLPIDAYEIGEAAAVLAVVMVLILAVGNLISSRNPRPIDPEQSWGKQAAGKMQMWLLVIYPVVFAPVALAYAARNAFETEWAFYAVLAVDLLLAAIFYSVALDTAVETVARDREQIIAALSRDQNVLAG